MKKVIVILMCLGMLFSCTVPSYSSFLVLNEEKQKESVEKDEPPVEETSDTEKKESVPEKENPAASENSEKQDVPAPEEKKESSENAGTETESGNEVSNVTEVKEPEHKEEDVKSESENHGNSQVVEKTEVNETPEKPEGSESVVKPEVLPNPEISNSPENEENQENKDVPESQETEKKEESPEYVKPATKKRKFRKRFWKKEGLEKKETEQAKDVTESEKDPENEAAGSETPPVEEKTEEKEPVEETGKTESKEDSEEESKEEKSETEKESQTEEIPPEVEPSEKEENGESEAIQIPEKETGESIVPDNSGETEIKNETEVKDETEAPENSTEKKDSENQTAENETPAVQEKNEKEEPAPETPKETEGAESGEESVEHEVPETSEGTGEPEVPETSGGTVEHEVPETSGGSGKPEVPETSGGAVEHGVPETSGGTVEHGAPESSGGTGEHGAPESSGGAVEHGVPETSGGTGESGAPEGTEGTVVSQETAKPEIPEVEPEPVRRKSEWTTVIYMAADNDLEIAAIQDINEIEAAGIDDEKMTVLVLIDRAEGYDFTNDDWTDTRLLKIVKDPSGLNGTIVSERLDCPDLDLYKSKNTELDMGNSYTLSALMNFARREYEAEHYALILWGHGTGWRAAGLTHPVNPRAVGIDDKTGTYLSVPAFADAVHEKDLDVIAYDTCFGSVIENLYEIRDESRYVVGAAGITPSCGFNYSDFINDFVLTDLSVETFVLALSKTSKVPVTITDCTGIKRIADAVNAFGKALADSIVTPSDREREFEVLFRKTKSYISSSYPCDMFLDLYDMAEKYITEEDDSISEKAEELRTALKLYTRTTGSQNPEVGINFIPMYKKGVAATAHSPEYFQQTSGSFTGTEKSQFVQEMGGWVPTRKGISLLDKLFYSIF